MNEFLYQAELAKLNTITSTNALIKQMGQLTLQHIKVPSTGDLKQPLYRYYKDQTIVLTGLYIEDLEFQITTVYRYALYLATRDRYFELKLDKNKLPQYVLWNIPYIDIDKTIQFLRIKYDTTRNS